MSEVVVAVATFADWLGQQMDRRGIRSGRRLGLETGLEEQEILDWATGRRVPQPYEVEHLAHFFGVGAEEPLRLRQRTELALAASRTRR